MLKKIVVIGPESTGKSTLCQQLAEHFATEWVPEYARQYLLENGINYTYKDLLLIAQGQLQQEDEYVERIKGQRQSTSFTYPQSSNFLFIDTDMYVMKVWCEYVFGKCHDFILKEIVNRTYDLYLLCNPDLPWTKDELREYPDQETRERLFKMYKDILINQSTPWTNVSGGYEERIQIAIDAVVKII